MKKILLLSFITMLSNAHAEDEKSWRASVGLGMAIKKNLRVGNTYEHMDKKVIVKPIPILTGNIGRFSLGAQGISFRAFGERMLEASVFIKREGDRYQGLGMTPRKESQFVGVSAKFFKYGLNISKDINGKSKGMITQFSYGELFMISEGFVLRGGLSVDWLDDKYAEYYYGVRKHEATATRNEYHLKNYLQPGINILPIYKLSERVSSMAVLGAKFIPKSVRNSPTMNGDKFEFGGFAGISYTF
ncbi:MAG: MipA/OmpV family protein [Bdellovibrionales bacterium]|nr:MipA/OmpV family protein [Bdellovibrionales bacterium]